MHVLLRPNENGVHKSFAAPWALGSGAANLLTLHDLAHLGCDFDGLVDLLLEATLLVARQALDHSAGFGLAGMV